MERRDFLKAGTLSGTSMALATLNSGCNNTSDDSTNKVKTYSSTLRHNYIFNSQIFYDTLSDEEKSNIDSLLPNYTPTQTPHHSIDDKLYVASPSALRVSLKSQNSRDTSGVIEYETSTTVNTNGYTIHMYYKKIDGEYVSSDYKFKDAYKNSVQDKDKVVDGNLPKYKLSYMVLVVPDGTDDDEDVVIDNPVRETVKTLLLRTSIFSHFSQDDMRYIVGKFNDIFTNKTNLENVINHVGVDDWFRYEVYTDADNNPILRKTQSTDSDGNIIHDIGDAIYSFPMRDILAKEFKKDLKKLMDDLSSDERISPLLVPRQTQTNDRISRWNSTIKQRAAEYDNHTYKVDDLPLKAEGTGIEINSVDENGVNLTVTNHYNRHVSVSYAQLNNDDTLYDEDIQQEEKMLPPRYALLGIPIGDSKVNLTLPFNEDASSLRVYFSSFSFTDGHYLSLYDTKPGEPIQADALKQLLSSPEEMTIVFELALPTALIAWGGMHIAQGSEWRKLLATYGFKFAKDIASPILGDANLNASETINAIVGPLVSDIVSGIGEIVAYILKNMAEDEVEDSVPIAGQIYRALCLAADISNLAQTLYALSVAKAVRYVDIKRYHTLKLQLKSDPKSFEFPNALTDIDIDITYDNGITAKQHHFTWDSSKVIPHTTDGGGSYATYDIDLDDQPSGGEITINVKLKRDGWVASYASLKTQSYTDDNIVIEVTNNKISLSGNSIYQHYAKLTNDGSTYKWNVKEDDKTLSSPSVDDELLSKNELFHISINDPIGAIGYSYKNLVTNEYNVKNISAVLEAPNQGIKSQTSTQMIQVNYSLLSDKSNEGSVIFEKKDGVTYIRNIDINSQSDSYEIDFSKNIGIFTTDTVTQFGYYEPENIIAALDTDAGVLHIIKHLNAAIDDTNKNRYSNVKSSPLTIKLSEDMDPTTQYLYNPKILTMSPAGDIIILEETSTNEIRLRAFNRYGMSHLDYVGFNNSSSTFSLKKESVSVNYLDISIEAKGYIYVLKQLGSDRTNEQNYYLDIYDPTSDNPNEPMVSTQGVSGGKIVVDYWRSVYTLNYETNQLDEPTVSLWIPPVM